MCFALHTIIVYLIDRPGAATAITHTGTHASDKAI